MRVTLRQLEILMAVAKHLSVNKAAKALHLSQPAVSMQIQQLEEALKVPLIEVIGRKVFLTDVGKEVVYHGQVIQQELEALKSTVVADRQLLRGELRLSIATSVQQVSFKLLGEFYKQHPDIALKINVSNRDVQLSQLLDNTTDLCIMGTPPITNHDIIGTVFLEFAFVIVASPNHPFATKKSLPLKALSEEVFIFGEEGSPTRTITEETLAKLFSHQKRRAVRSIEINNNESIKYAVQSGLGIAVLPSLALEPELSNKQLAILKVKGFPEKGQLYIVHLKQKKLTPVANAFKNYLLTRKT